MSTGLIGKKIGMSRMIDENGKMIPVTLIYTPQCEVVGKRTQERDGYEAVVLGAFPKNKKHKNVGNKYTMIREVKDCECEGALDVSAFEGVEKVKVTGVSKGRGFSGVLKRWNFARGRETHGSHHHREPGSSGMCAKPGRILRGKKFPGQYGNVKKTLRSVSVMSIDKENEVVVLKGCVPGPNGGYIFMRTA